MFSGLQVIQDEMRQRDVLLEDEEEDFLDEATVNPEGRGCPPVLLLCAAAVLAEITSFMRETYKGVPKQGKARGQVKASVEVGGGGAGGARRWSYANQSIAGQSNASHQSLHNSSDTGKLWREDSGHIDYNGIQMQGKSVLSSKIKTTNLSGAVRTPLPGLAPR